MQLELTRENYQIEQKFRSLTSFDDVADLLEVHSQMLFEILVKNKKNNYSKFEIDKKSGGKRVIYSPDKNLSIIQKKLAYILNLIYTPHKNAYGFVPRTSTITNAQKHVKQKYVLNFDLKDFFPSISFARTRAMFLSYFKFNGKVATTLANICCHHKGFLPQGAPTSPMVSNIISYRLDKNLTKLAERYNCKYTRYADDVTISTSRGTFPKEIAFNNKYEESALLSEKVTSIVRKNGFSINDSKTRLRDNYQRLEVTGITVNEKLNVNRNYIRYIRVIIHAAEKGKKNNKLEEAKKMFNQKYNFRQSKMERPPDMFTVLRGMISYVGQVKGKNDGVFLKLGERYNELVKNLDEPQPFLTLSRDYENFNRKNTYVIESLYYDGLLEEEPFDVAINQGTAFLLKGVGLVTNAHVISEYIEYFDYGASIKKIKVHQSTYTPSTGSSYAELMYYNTVLDIAILKIDGVDTSKSGFEYKEKIHIDMDVKILGYPEYVKGTGLSSKDAKIINERKTLPHNGKSEIRYEVTSVVYKGNSGGPILDMDNKVVGVAVKGQDHPNEIIPIKDVLTVFNEQMKLAHYF